MTKKVKIAQTVKVAEVSQARALRALYESEGRNITARWQIARIVHDYVTNKENAGNTTERYEFMAKVIADYDALPGVPPIRLSVPALRQYVRAWRLYGELVTKGVPVLYAPTTAVQHGKNGWDSIEQTMREANQLHAGARKPGKGKGKGKGKASTATGKGKASASGSAGKDTLGDDMKQALDRLARIASSLDANPVEILNHALDLLESDIA